MKIFGIGLSKTGTTSLANALEILGYRVKDCLGVTDYRKGDLSSIDKAALLNNDALTDTPIPSYYRELDVEYPDSKFVLTVRDMGDWLKSCKKQFNQKLADKQTEAHNQLFFDLYESTVFNEEKFRVGYKRFVEGVLDYFKDRTDDLLIINVSKGDGWEKLCPFLGKSIPDVPFPKSNVTQIRWFNLHELASGVRSSSSGLKDIYQQFKSNVDSTDESTSTLLSLLHLDPISKINRSAKKVQKLIEKELIQANSNIPIISKNKHDVPIDNRKAWNHFWLIDCSEGQPFLNDESVGYTVNIALIEDGYPYLGIVYAPALDVLYYASLGKGAYRVEGNENPVRIEHEKNEGLISQKIKKPANLLSNTNVSWKLCQSLGEQDILGLNVCASMEWQTAAGHAFIKAVGHNKLLDSVSNNELMYNKRDWKNPQITVGEK